MKKQLKFIPLILLVFCISKVNAQSWAIALTPSTQCYSAGSNTALGSMNVNAPGATSYTWAISASTGSCNGSYTNAAANGSLVNISYPCCGNYSITCTPYNGTTALTPTVMTILINCLPSPSITSTAPNSTLCSGNSMTLSGLGGLTYTWVPGNFVGASMQISPNSTTCYSLIAANAAGCTAVTSSCYSVFPSYSISVVGSSVVCAGSSVTYSLSGGPSFVTFPGNINSPNPVITPTANITITFSCPTVPYPCPATFTTALLVLPAPPVSITGNNTVCLGSSSILYGVGAISYIWSTVSSSPSIQVLPNLSTTYSVIGTGANSCTNLAVHTLSVNPACALVWPGDANSDGVVNSNDVFELGLSFNNTGAARTPTSNAYASQYANAWTGTVSTGANKCHADCNGDGTVNNADTVAIYNNYLQTHTFKTSLNSSINPDIYFVSSQNTAFPGVWNNVDIMLGSPTNSVSQIYGVAFDVNFDTSLIQMNSAYLVYSASFLNASNQNVQFRKPAFNAQKIYAASVRVDGNNVSGNGKIATLYFKVKPTVPVGTVLNVSISNASKINKSASISSLAAGSSTIQIIKNTVGINESALLQKAVHLFPNPASKLVTLVNDNSGKIDYFIYNLIGQELQHGEFENSKILDLTNYQNGTYFIQFKTGVISTYNKLIIEKN